MAQVPDDVLDAYDSFKLVILRHRAEGWTETDEDSVVCLLWELMRQCWNKQPTE